MSAVVAQVETLPMPRFDGAALIAIVERAIRRGSPITLGVAR